MKDTKMGYERKRLGSIFGGAIWVSYKKYIKKGDWNLPIVEMINIVGDRPIWNGVMKQIRY